MRFDPEAGSIVLRSPWRHITFVPVDPATATELSTDMRGRLAKVADPAAAKLIVDMEPGFPLWDEVAAGAWLDPAIVTASEPLFVNANTQFGAGYGDLLSWDAGNQPGLGEQRADVVRAIDPARLEALMMRVIAGRTRPKPRR